MSELLKHINMYIRVYIQYRKAEKDNNKKKFNIYDNIIILSTIQPMKISLTLQRIKTPMMIPVSTGYGYTQRTKYTRSCANVLLSPKLQFYN